MQTTATLSHHIRVRAIMLLLGVIALPPSPVRAAERPHVSLVEPEKTDCVFCHETLSPLAHEDMQSRGCLECHTFVKKADTTLVVVEEILRTGAPSSGDRSRSADTAADQEPGLTETTAGSDSLHHQTALAAESGPESTTDRRDAAPPATRIPDHSQASPPGIKPPVPDQLGNRYSAGSEAFSRGEFDVAFDLWREMLADGNELYSVQVEVDRLLTSVQGLFAAYDDHSLYVVVRDEQYWVYTGLFRTRAEAEKAVSLLPEPLRQGGAFATAVSAIVRQR